MVLLGSVFRLLGNYNLSAYQRAMARRAGIEDLLPLTILNRKYELATAIYRPGGGRL